VPKQTQNFAIVQYARHAQRRICSKNVLVSRKRAHKNGGKPIAKRIRRDGRGDFSADPLLIFRFQATAVLSEKKFARRDDDLRLLRETVAAVASYSGGPPLK